MNNQAATKNKKASWQALKWDVEKYLIFLFTFSGTCGIIYM